MIRPRCFLWLLPPLIALVPFARLVVDPSALVVDGQRPSVDRALPRDAEAVGNDLTRLFLPHHARVAATVAKTGRVPGWDPAGFGGRPLVGNPQAGLWYPPVWLAWRWWSPSALGWLTIAHLMFGGVGMDVLCRSSRMRPFASAVAGALWCTSPYVLAQAYEGHYPHAWSASFSPWAIWAAMGWRDRKPRGLLLPPIVALSLLTGHAQEAYYLGLGLAIWLCVDLASRWRRGLLVLSARRTASLAVLAVISLGLVAIEVLPDAFARPFVARRLPPTASDAGKYHVRLANLAQLATPLALGGPADYVGPQNYWESLLSIGWTPLVLAAWGAAKSGRRRLVGGWVMVAIITTLFAFGRGFGVFDLFFALVPGMGLFRVPSRVLFLTTLATSVLAGLGVEAVGRNHGSGTTRGTRKLVRSYGLATVAILIVSVSTGTLGRVVFDPRFLLAYLGSGIGIFVVARYPRQRKLVAITLGSLAVVETVLYGVALIHTAPPSRFLGPDPVGMAIASHRPDVPFRIRARDAFYGDARAFAIGLEKTNLNDSFQIGFAADLYERLYPMFGEPTPPRFPRRFRPDLQADILDRMNVRFLVSDRDDSRFGWPVVASGEWGEAKFTIRENPDPLPRAYVVPHAIKLEDGPGVPDHFLDHPARESVILSQDVPHLPEARQPFTPAEYVSTNVDRVEVRVVTSKPGFLVVADTWMPGWSAELDGEPATVYRGNRAQRVVVLPAAGRHRIVMMYAPPGLRLGRWLTGISWFVVFAQTPFVGWVRRRRRRNPRGGGGGVPAGIAWVAPPSASDPPYTSDA